MEASARGRESLGPTWQRRPAPQERRLAPPGATLAPATSPIHGSYSTSSPMRWFKLVCINGHDREAMDPWVHCHRLGRLQLTLEPSYLPNFHMCCFYHRHWEPTIAVGSRGGGMECRSAPSSAAWRPKAPNRPLTAYKYPSPHSTL
jgi:hypothetical protein